MSTFVSVGNAKQPFDRLVKAVVREAANLPGPVFIQHGAADASLLGGCEGSAFLKMDEFAAHVGAAELLILHAGAGSMIHAVQAGRVPVVVPRRAEFGEHIDNHQVELTSELRSSEKVVVCDDPDDLLAAVAAALERQRGNRPELEPPAMIELVRQALLRKR